MGRLNLVASTTSSRRPFSALPTISSDSPSEYTSAVSTRLIPASSAVWIIRIDSAWSVFPMAPSIMVPSASSLTEMPVPPSVLRFILVLFPRSLRPRYSSARPSELGLAGQPVRRVWPK